MGVYSDESDPPVYYQVVDTRDCVRYSDSAQAPWFMDRIRFAYGGTSTNVRLDSDGTIRWFGYYWLHLGDWLYGGTTPVTDEVLRASHLRPVGVDWPSATPTPPPANPPAEPTTTPDAGSDSAEPAEATVDATKWEGT